MPPKKWKFILIELEIDEVAVASSIASHLTFNHIYDSLLYEGQTQRLPWAIFISRSSYKDSRKISGDFFDHDENGRL